MKIIDVKNKDYIDLLQSIEQFVLDNFDTLNELAEESYSNIDDEYKDKEPRWFSGKECLDVIKNREDHVGYPMYAKALALRYNAQAAENDDRVYPIIDEFDKKYLSKLTDFIGARNTAVVSFYPNDGYMSWHTNENASGYNLLLNYSPNGVGSLNIIGEDGEVYRQVDSKGWTTKAGYFGNSDEEPFWHSVDCNNEWRFTIGFVIADKAIWEDFIEDIELP